ncbi:bifunctional oligoribonuclease/PAP phosphatase NrnA [bacterium]|nr:bifunctional oligoribonuclease/PAP phosphatase NrnA [bacterium]
MIDHVAGEIRNAKRVALFAHRNPDGDALGSLIAMDALLEILGVETITFCIDPIPDIYSFLPRLSRFKRSFSTQDLAQVDCVLTLDVAVGERMNEEIWEWIQSSGLPVVNIDHHLTNSRFGIVNWVRPKKAATAMMVYELFEHIGIELTPDAAIGIYTGIMTDTGHFSFKRTGAETFEMAAHLVRAGADPTQLKEKIYFSQPERKVTLLGRIIDRLECDSNHGVAWTWSSLKDWEELGVSTPDYEGIPDYANIVKDVDLLLLFREIPNEPIKVNLRSKGDVDASAFAEAFGGGGHINAAGATYAGTLEEAIKDVVASARLYLGNRQAG